MINFKEELLENFKIVLEKLPDNIYEDCKGTYDLRLQTFQISDDEKVETIKSFNFEFVELIYGHFQLEDYYETDKELKFERD